MKLIAGVALATFVACSAAVAQIIGSGDSTLDKAMQMCRDHDASHLTYSGTGINWEPGFVQSCDKVKAEYHRRMQAVFEAQAREREAKRLQETAAERKWLDDFAATLPEAKP